ncbi:hypothetical protein C1645_780603, partial [Glomus cerebriforme]
YCLLFFKITQTNPLQYHSNACPLCLTCLVCTEVYGKNCICLPKELKWQRKSNEYKIDFCHKSLDMVATRKLKIKLDNVFVQKCINKFEYYKKTLNKPKKIKSKSDLASERIINLDSNKDTIGDIDTIDLTKQKQKQIVTSKLLINQNYYT